MLKYIILSVLAVSTQLIAIFIWSEYVWLYKFANGGVGGAAIDHIQPVFWWIIAIEIFTISSLIAYKNYKEKYYHSHGD
ncbi:hypothetical protein [Halobacillus litoralis]|uniref:DUF3923 domain-containing protein n=1 Tax=Halobacillus litoralis TaxID=45668 RepID=A0A410M9D1_9BACI|nr:hypothetical protein [Halobacillus litoralis]QAS51297.1 hypothetical protein HLI_03245 [Halobacillus litoralis]